ncbi:hypothetical protein B7P43_G01328 [Cryptotermes secundus]|uniref:Abasic site processing protein HMCES n=1 Tax=Cryptotermes secundus TaxID=105785 RepID=A0A2J7RE82_9NEOP|nr:hypothetical protein B7P43_G01328 [Cryptotermes secundus]
MADFREQRAAVKFCFLLGESGAETLEMLKTTYKDDAMGKTQVFEWFSHFKNGEMSIDDKHENVEKIREIIKEDRRWTTEEIVELSGVCIEDPATWSCDWSEVGGWRGPKLLYMAGLFDVWTSSEGEEIYSYSVITLDSDNTLAWLHHRMPAILEGEQIQDWLDIERVSSRAALAMIRPMKLLTWHPVSTLVNNSRNKEPQCNKPITLEKPKPASQSQVFMESWLKKGTVKHELDKLENESAMSPDDSRDESHLVMKKIKKEETSSTT